MNTQENILVKANIQKEGNSKRIKIIFVVYQSLLVCHYRCYIIWTLRII